MSVVPRTWGRLRRPGAADAVEGVVRELAIVLEVAIEGADRADLARDAGLGDAFAEEEGEVAPQIAAAGAEGIDLPAGEGAEEVDEVAAVVTQVKGERLRARRAR